MSRQDQDATLAMQQMMAQIKNQNEQMAQIRAELTELKSRPIIQPQPHQLSQPQPYLPKATSRRKALTRIGGSLVAASLGSSLPLIPTSAGPLQQTMPETTIGSNGTGQTNGSGMTIVNPNAVPELASDGSVTQAFGGFDFRPVVSGTSYSFQPAGGISWTGSSRSGVRVVILTTAPIELPG